jgi:hypothetical protein
VKGLIVSPINSVQKEFNALCLKGGGPGGGPARSQVIELLKYAGKRLNKFAYEEIGDQFHQLQNRNPWHVCFAIGLSWGHMAKVDVDFSDATCRLMENWNDSDLHTAKSFYMYRGPEVIEQSLKGGKMMFDSVRLPPTLPGDLVKLKTGQDRWLGRVLAPNRPPYVGAWNSTAMFMVALFAQPDLAAKMQEDGVLLPPSGAMFTALWSSKMDGDVEALMAIAPESAGRVGVALPTAFARRLGNTP